MSSYSTTTESTKRPYAREESRARGASLADGSVDAAARLHAGLVELAGREICRIAAELRNAIPDQVPDGQWERADEETTHAQAVAKVCDDLEALTRRFVALTQIQG